MDSKYSTLTSQYAAFLVICSLLINAGLGMNGLMIFIYLVVKQLKKDIIAFMAIIPFVMVAFLQISPTFYVGFVGCFLSIISNISPLEKIVSDFEVVT